MKQNPKSQPLYLSFFEKQKNHGVDVSRLKEDFDQLFDKDSDGNPDVTDLDEIYVNEDGDIMTGDLIMQDADIQITPESKFILDGDRSQTYITTNGLSGQISFFVSNQEKFRIEDKNNTIVLNADVLIDNKRRLYLDGGRANHVFLFDPKAS